MHYVWHCTVQFNTVQVILETIFPATHLTCAKTWFKPNQTLAWNCLPHHVQEITNNATFRRQQCPVSKSVWLDVFLDFRLILTYFSFRHYSRVVKPSSSFYVHWNTFCCEHTSNAVQTLASQSDASKEWWLQVIPQTTPSNLRHESASTVGCYWYTQYHHLVLLSVKTNT